MKTFDQVQIKKPAVNVFNLSHDVKATYNFDRLYPFLCHPVYPGETFNCRAEVFLRTMPLIAPVMHNVDMHFYFFFVPNRIIWNENRKNDWKVFITGGEDGTAPSKDENDIEVMPHWSYGLMTAFPGYLADGSLCDYMGFPSIKSTYQAHGQRTEPISSLPFRAYQMIYNEYFRNQNLQNEIEFSYDAGEESVDDMKTLMTWRYKNWEKDYFTACLPWTQRGEAVYLPIETKDVAIDMGQITGNVIVDRARPWNSDGAGVGIGSDNQQTLYTTVDIGVTPVELTGEATMSASSGAFTFSGLAIGTINDFRYCLRLQQWLENNARCGSRYIEQLLSHFGVVSSDARLQRPELLGGGKVPLIFSDVAQTSETTDTSVQGNLSGKGTLYGKTNGFKKYFEEHGILMGICCIVPRTSYSQGIPRYWTLMDKTDFYFPEFAHLGEQAVLNKEVYYNPCLDDASLPEEHGPDDVFGYIGRFDELRYIPSSIHGQLRSDLQYWHFGRIFSEQPVLNSDFVTAQTRADVWSVEDVRDGAEDPFVAQIHLDVKAVRPMPKFATPSL